MVAISRCSRRKFLHVLFTALVCVSVFYVSDGNKTSRKRSERRKIATSIRRYCREMTWFDHRQRNICARSPKMMKVVQKGVENALTECRRLFKDYRWNCSPLTWNEVFDEAGILKKRSRETAFVQALASASVMVEIAKSCASGNYEHCSCGQLPKNLRRNPKNSRRKTSGSFTWDGCPDNFGYGAHFTKRFMDPRRINNHAKKTKSHNQQIGRKVVRKLKVRKCNCHGKSNACSYKTCWHVAPDIAKVGNKIWELYQNAIRSQWNKTTNVLVDGDRPKREKNQEASKLNSNLAYFSSSENFCEANIPMGIMGTYGRTCNSTSQGSDGCSTMCCGRPHKTTKVTQKENCRCKFVWCCNVECETCNTTRSVDTCL